MLTYAQDNLPLEVKITDDGHLKYGGNPTEGLYDPGIVHKIELTLDDSDWFDIMDGMGMGPNATPGESLMGTLTFNDDIVLDSVMIGIKGQTSDFRNNSEKKSFKVEIDELKDQDLLGYDNLNFNCAFEDFSSMREVLYYDICRSFTPSLKGAFIDLYINGQYWGPYNNIQQIEGTYIKEWFGDNDGTRWRAVAPDDVSGGGGPGGGGPGGDPFGTGSSTLNYNGVDSTDYNENYTLKKTSKEDPWQDLIELTEVLNTTSINDLYEALNPIFDIDRSLWILAQETIFSDDDSYIYKGGMDYYVYWDHATGRMMNMEVDGNSVMVNEHVNWDIFYNENDSRFPLLNRMLQNPEIRQRYLAHVRTILGDHYIIDDIHDRIDEFADILDQRIQDDPKKIYSYNEFVNGVSDLKNFITNRHQVINNYNEVNRTGITVQNISYSTENGLATPPNPYKSATVTLDVFENASAVKLYFATGTDGAFERITMADIGNGTYTADIPGYAANTLVRYYIEAIKDDSFSTASYFPAGAEHDVFIYQVSQAPIVAGDIVINEIMADNETTAVDGEDIYEDWIELYNTGTQPVDLTGYYLSDDESDIVKWQFPDGTLIGAGEYLIIWADDDPSQTTDTEIHCNFKLSNNGESLLLVNPNEEIEDQIIFDEQYDDVGFARFPNGTGDFEYRTATFNMSNDASVSGSDDLNDMYQLNIYPNPSTGVLFIDDLSATNSYKIEVFDVLGKLLYFSLIEAEKSSQKVDLNHLSPAWYTIKLTDEKGKFSIAKVLLIR